MLVNRFDKVKVPQQKIEPMWMKWARRMLRRHNAMAAQQEIEHLRCLRFILDVDKAFELRAKALVDRYAQSETCGPIWIRGYWNLNDPILKATIFLLPIASEVLDVEIGTVPND